MIKGILKAAGASLFAAMLMLGMAGNASATLLAPGGTANFDGADEFYKQDTGLDLLSGVDFTGVDAHVYTIEVTGGTKSVEVVYDLKNLPPLGDVGIANLTYTWSGGLSTLQLTNGSGLQCDGFNGCADIAAIPLEFILLLTAGTHTVTVSGTQLSRGGEYTLLLTAVPLPAAALLFGSVLLGGGLMRRRKMIKKFGLPA